MPDAAPPNPYIGPRAFTENNSQCFFGRTEETRELGSLVIARRAVLLYAQSGSGKTSLLQASLVPELKRRKRVATFPIARVTGSVDASSCLYVDNALASLFPDVPAASLRGKTFSEAFRAVLVPNNGVLVPNTEAPQIRRQARLVIFDQFEEIFTYHPELTDQRQAFFAQLGECLSAYPDLSLLLSMREDYLADLEAYAPLLPDRMRTRMRLERLGVESAVEAIRQPAALSGLPFAAGVAEQLVDNLRRIRTGSGANGFALGLYVEPVQLQIVCRQLWSRVTLDTTADPTHRKAEIDADDIAKHANVDDALIQFYRDSLAKAQQAGVTERVLRRWFDERLITPAGTRGLVYRGAYQTEGLPNAAADTLRDCYIIRADLRGGNVWYELAHDRLVEPVRQDNMNWKAAYRNPVADAWARNPDNLLTGSALRDALQYTKKDPRELTQEEWQFLKKSDAAEKKAKALRKKLIGGGVTVIVALSILTAWALREASHAEQQAAIATSGRLATAALLYKANRPDLAALLSLEGRRAFDSFEARNSLLSTLQANQGLIATLDQPNDSVYAVAFNPGGAILATAGSDGTVWLWDAARHKQMGGPLQGHSDYIAGLAFSPDGKMLASASHDETVRLWDVASGKPLGDPLRCGGAANGIAFSPDGKVLAAASDDHTVRLWDAASRSALGQLKGSPREVMSIAFSRDGKMLASAGKDRMVRLWDMARQKQLGDPLQGHSDSVWSVAFSPDGKLLASAGKDRTVRLWEVGAHKPMGAPLQGHTGDVWGVTFKPDGTMLASASADRTIRLWDVSTHIPIGEPLDGHSAPVNGVTFSPDGKTLASASDDQTARLWDLARCEQLAYAMVGPSGSVSSVAFRPDGKLLASAGEDRLIRLWDTAKRLQLSNPLQGHSGEVNSVAFSPDGRMLASASHDDTVRLWDVVRRQPLGGPLRGHSGNVNSVAFSPDGTMVASASDDRTVRLWDVAGRKPLGEPLRGHTGDVESVAFSRYRNMLASAGFDQTIRFWDVASRQPLGEPLPSQIKPVSVAFSPDATILASAGGEQVVRLWDAASHQSLGDPLQGHSDNVNSVSFSPDGAMLASASDDQTVRLWDTASHQPLGDPLLGSGEVTSIAFGPDGKMLASATRFGTVWIWDIDPNSWAARLCRVANRNLSISEWRHFIGATVPYRRTCPDLPPGVGAPAK